MSSIKKVVKRVLPQSLIILIKNIIGRVYRIAHGLNRINTSCNIVEIGEKHTQTFFGYYDISPFNCKGEIIYLEVPKSSKTANIILNTTKGNSRKVISITNAWNTQQGSRLRWLPENDDVICFNDYVDERYIHKQINVRTKEERVIDVPLYDISSDGRLGVTVNFERLGVLRPGYGYTCRPYVPIKDLSQEGISLVDLATGIVQKLVTYRDIADAMGESSTDYSQNYINHLSFSPDSKKFLFFWLKDLPNWAEAALLTYDILKKKIVVLEKKLRVSHYTWLDNDSILCTAIAGTSVKDMQCRYYLYQEGKPRKIIGENALLRDGHPTLYKENVILTDTYPDRHSFQELFLYDMEKNEKNRLVHSYSFPVKDSVYRTDMHPRFNHDKSLICYDANVIGERRLYIIKHS